MTKQALQNFCKRANAVAKNLFYDETAPFMPSHIAGKLGADEENVTDDEVKAFVIQYYKGRGKYLMA